MAILAIRAGYVASAHISMTGSVPENGNPFLVEATATVATQLMCGGVCQRPVLGYFVDEIIVSDNRIDIVVDWLDYVGDTRFERTFTFDDVKTRFVPLREFEPSRDGRGGGTRTRTPFGGRF